MIQAQESAGRNWRLTAAFRPGAAVLGSCDSANESFSRRYQRVVHEIGRENAAIEPDLPHHDRPARHFEEFWIHTGLGSFRAFSSKMFAGDHER